MKKSEASLYLSVEEGVSLREAYEEKLFEWKNFFVHRFPIPKLFNKKLEQLDRLEQAYAVLGGGNIEVPASPIKSVVYDSNLKQSFQHFFEDRNQLKKQLFAATTATEIIFIVQGLIEITRAYAKSWSAPSLDNADVLVSKEVDPVELLKAIDDAISQGVLIITDITKLSDGHMVLNEAKRLSLWAKMEVNE